MMKLIKKYEVYIEAGFLIWAILVYLLGLLFLTLYTNEDSGVLFWCAVTIFTPAGVYIAFQIGSAENTRWYKYVAYSLIASFLLIFVGYFTFLKTDLLWSLLTRPTTLETLYIKSVEKDYLPKHGWDHTNINTVYKGKTLQFEASRTAFFLLQDKDSLTVTIGQSYTGNYFVTDIHLPGAERWSARRTYWVDWLQRYSWVAVFLVLAFTVALLKTRYWPNVTFAKLGWKRFVLLCVGIVTGIFVLLYIALVVYIKFIHPA